ncbi:toll/interleukin-1 receptor domain-containing protein [Xanthobacteraceae bacterium Astr-EGSB]|uniref:toll/interleukin-1 receptor domain-containing protein n=1 Tax=Astrobacterium formosum TaxID=3069710 RepID=UPI0027B87C0E|nr:toll/interleukin-1 receptor domain-containing protein [Xanthobacteraceae bacterium Astr-EGSB]
MHETMPKVFLSYAWGDRAFAATVKAALSDVGVSASDDLDIAPGESLAEAVLESIRASEIVVFVVPEHEGVGKNALFELGAARAAGKHIVSLVPDRKRAANSDVAVRLSNLMVLDASERSPSTIAEQVLTALKPELAAG